MITIVVSRPVTAIAYERMGERPAEIILGGAFSYRAYPKVDELEGQAEVWR